MAQPKLVYSLGFQAFKEGKDFAPVPFPLGTVPQSNSTSATIPEKLSSKIEGVTFKQTLACDLLVDVFTAVFIFFISIAIQ